MVAERKNLIFQNDLYHKLKQNLLETISLKVLKLMNLFCKSHFCRCMHLKKISPEDIKYYC